MKKVSFAIPFLLIPLVSCVNNKGSSVIVEEQKYTATFLLNCKAEDIELGSGYIAYADNLLYTQYEIKLGQKLTKPAEDPVRNNYVFDGWYKEVEGINEWNFDTDVATSSVFLYAKWGTAQQEEYVEPEYVPTERIITDKAFDLTGILSAPISAGKVNLTAGAINRLTANKSDVNFALNYGRKEGVTFSSTYNDSTKTITVKYVENGTESSINVVVNDITSSLRVTSNSYYETKAQNYEAKGANFENYHIMLAGSSSMENWSTSTEDLAPIVSYNHGIGGTRADEWRDQLAERLIFPYAPKCVVLYVGVNNIINNGDSGETTGGYCVDLFDKIHNRLPDTKIFYVMINKLPGYMHHQAKFDVCNQMCTDYANTHSYMDVIDAGTCLLKENGEPNSAYFLTDGLHMSKYGYVLWGGVVKQTLINWMKNE